VNALGSFYPMSLHRIFQAPPARLLCSKDTHHHVAVSYEQTGASPMAFNP
jgi:hypothetical protein